MNAAALTDALIVDLDCCDCSTELTDRWERDALTVAEFNAAMAEFAAEKSPAGGYAKLRGTLLFVDTTGVEQSLGFRIDVDHRMSEGKTLAERMATAAKFWTTDRGREFARASNDSADELHTLYVAASEATQI